MNAVRFSREVAITTVPFLLVIMISTTVAAADWVHLSGSEEGRASDGPALMGFFRVGGEQVFSNPVANLKSEGLSGYNGENPSFNLISGTRVQRSFQLRNVRIGVRGSAPRSDRRVSYFMLMEMGSGGLTLEDPVVVSDATLTLSLSGLPKMRMGKMKTPGMDETLQSLPVASDLADFSLVAGRLMQERDISEGAYGGAVYGFRDVGLQLFDSYLLGKSEVSWAVMVGNGRAKWMDNDQALDTWARLQYAFLPAGNRHKGTRDEVAAFVWFQRGERLLDTDRSHTRERAGAGFHYRSGALELRTEAVVAKGVLFSGQAPAFPGNPLSILPDGEAFGGTLGAGYRVVPHVELNLAGALVNQEPGKGAAERVFSEMVLGAQYIVSPSTRLMFNLKVRDFRAPAGSADAQTLLQSVGPRLSLTLITRL